MAQVQAQLLGDEFTIFYAVFLAETSPKNEPEPQQADVLLWILTTVLMTLSPLAQPPASLNTPTPQKHFCTELQPFICFP